MEVKEAYCSKEVCELLKEKGFDIEIPTYTAKYCDIGYGSYWNWNQSSRLYSCPTHQMACDWVRKKGWHISVQLSYDDDYNAVYYVTISSTKTFLGEDIGELDDKYFPTVEEATEEALKFLLENLI